MTYNEGTSKVLWGLTLLESLDLEGTLEEDLAGMSALTRLTRLRLKDADLAEEDLDAVGRLSNALPECSYFGP